MNIETKDLSNSIHTDKCYEVRGLYFTNSVFSKPPFLYSNKGNRQSNTLLYSYERSFILTITKSITRTPYITPNPFSSEDF